MASTNSVKQDLAAVRGSLLVLMQEGDLGDHFEPNDEWADLMYRAWELCGEAIQHISLAEDLT